MKLSFVIGFSLLTLVFGSAFGGCLCDLDSPADFTAEHIPEQSVLDSTSKLEAAMQEADAELLGDSEVVSLLDSNELSAIAGMDAASMTEAGMAEATGEVSGEIISSAVSGAFLGLLGSVGAIYEVYHDPDSLLIDKIAVTGGWVPFIGELLMATDFFWHMAKANAQVAKINRQLAMIHDQQAYADFGPDKKVTELLDLAKKSIGRDALDNLLAKGYTQLVDDRVADYKRRVEKVTWSLDNVTSPKIAENTTVDLKRLSLYFTFLFDIKMPVRKRFNFFRYIVLHDDVLRDKPAARIACINGVVNNDKSKFVCANAILDYFVSEVQKEVLVPGSKMRLLIGHYANAHNGLAARIKAYSIKQILDAKKGIHAAMVKKYTENADLMLPKFVEALKQRTKDAFLEAEGLTDKGESRDPICWHTEKYDCVSAVTVCNEEWKDVPAVKNYCFRMAQAPDVCKNRVVYNDYDDWSLFLESCKIMDYEATKDPEREKALAALDLIYPFPEAPFDKNELDLSFFEINEMIAPFDTTVEASLPIRRLIERAMEAASKKVHPLDMPALVNTMGADFFDDMTVEPVNQVRPVEPVNPFMETLIKS
ncbi:MAG: hypothetical protein RPU59_06380 [Candidatus Sedimenticola sp. (ex Thyasira tokunagai)]